MSLAGLSPGPTALTVIGPLGPAATGSTTSDWFHPSAETSSAGFEESIACLTLVTVVSIGIELIRCRPIMMSSARTVSMNECSAMPT